VARIATQGEASPSAVAFGFMWQAIVIVPAWLFDVFFGDEYDFWACGPKESAWEGVVAA